MSKWFQNMTNGQIVAINNPNQVVYINRIRYESLSMPRTNQTAINTHKVMENAKS